MVITFLLSTVLVVVSRSPRRLVVVSLRLRVGIVILRIGERVLRVIGRVVGRVVGGTNFMLKDEHSTSGIWKDVALFDGELGSDRSLGRCPT